MGKKKDITTLSVEALQKGEAKQAERIGGGRKEYVEKLQLNM